MFKNLTDLRYKRTSKQAFGFYLAYFVFTILLAGLLGIIASILTNVSDNYLLGVNMGTLVAIIVSLTLAFVVVTKKKLSNNFGYILLCLVAGILAYVGGGLLGLIPVAYLTTRK